MKAAGYSLNFGELPLCRKHKKAADSEERLKAFADSFFEDSQKSGFRGCAAKRIFMLRLRREYKRLICEGFSSERAAAAAIGRAEELFKGIFTE